MRLVLYIVGVFESFYSALNLLFFLVYTAWWIVGLFQTCQSMAVSILSIILWSWLCKDNTPIGTLTFPRVSARHTVLYCCSLTFSVFWARATLHFCCMRLRHASISPLSYSRMVQFINGPLFANLSCRFSYSWVVSIDIGGIQYISEDPPFVRQCESSINPIEGHPLLYASYTAGKINT